MKASATDLKAKLYNVDESFYYGFRTAIPDFHELSVLVSFIQANMDKVILVGEFSAQQYPLESIEKILDYLKLINDCDEFSAAQQQIFG